MALSESTINKLAAALTSDVIEYIHDDMRYAEFMMEVIPDAITTKLGTHDPELITELSMCIMDRIYLKCAD